MGDILLWIVLISAALGTGCTALASSGTGRLWHVDALELRRQQRFRHVLSCHVDAIRLSRREAAASVQPGWRPAGGSSQVGEDPFRFVPESCRSPFAGDPYGGAPPPADSSLNSSKTPAIRTWPAT
ncbi:hypothetical protein GCM10010343_23260 [Streptomyces avidinii]|nr:hypothetical protein GCM10010343_23260 [Streptomyces avidinii]